MFKFLFKAQPFGVIFTNQHYLSHHYCMVTFNLLAMLYFAHRARTLLPYCQNPGEEELAENRSTEERSERLMLLSNVFGFALSAVAACMALNSSIFVFKRSPYIFAFVSYALAELAYANSTSYLSRNTDATTPTYGTNTAMQKFCHILVNLPIVYSLCEIIAKNDTREL